MVISAAGEETSLLRFTVRPLCSVQAFDGPAATQRLVCERATA